MKCFLFRHDTNENGKKQHERNRKFKIKNIYSMAKRYRKRRKHKEGERKSRNKIKWRIRRKMNEKKG